MSIIKCPECEKEISNHAEKCPQCGYPLKCDTQDRSSEYNKKSSEKKGSTTTINILAVVGGIIAILVLISAFKDLFIGIY